MAWGYGRFPEYVSVAQRRADALAQMQTLRKQGQTIEPVRIEGRAIARSFWGKGWCDHLEAFSDFESRLPRGRTYARNGSVCHLGVTSGRLDAYVSGSELYTVRIDIDKLPQAKWEAIKQRCAGRIGSMLELLQGRLSDEVMHVVTDPLAGLFPLVDEIKLECSCPDWANMCKHVAAVLYGVGSRLDQRPDLLFTLRGVDQQELIGTALALPQGNGDDPHALADDQLADIFGIELDGGHASPASAPVNTPERAADTQPPKRAKPTAIARPATQSKPQGSRRSGASARPAVASSKQSADVVPTAKLITRLRRRLKLTGVEFAEAMGVAPNTVYRWESATGPLKLNDRSRAALADLQAKADRK